LTGKKYLLGDSFSAADVVVGYSVWFMKFMDLLDQREDKVLIDYLDLLKEREAFKKVFKRT